MEFEFEEGWDPKAAAANLARELAVDPSETMEDLAARLLRENLPSAVMSVIHTAIHSGTERVRLDAAKYVIDRVLGRMTEEPLGGKGTSDPLAAFAASFIKDVEDMANGKK